MLLINLRIQNRAKEILSLREEHERSKMSRSEDFEAKLEAIKQAQESRFESKKVSSINRQKAQVDVVAKKRDGVMEVRRVRRANELEKMRQREEELKRARDTHESVRMAEQRMREQRARMEEERKRQTLEEYHRRVVEEERQTLRKESEVARMERMEMELISRLQNAQLLQKQAYDQLETALTSQAREQAREQAQAAAQRKS
jgi:hypothetical protein